MSTKISQVEARRLRREVEQLKRERDEQRRRWCRSYPGGTNIAQLTYASGKEFIPAVVENSIRLQHAVVVTVDGGTLSFYALPLPERTP